MSNPSPMQTALTFHDAWSAKDVDTVMSVIAADVVCETPAGRLEGADAFRRYIEGFNAIFTGADMIEALASGETVALVHDTHSLPVPSAKSFTRLRVRDGEIVDALFIFDRVPYEAARAAAAA